MFAPISLAKRNSTLTNAHTVTAEIAIMNKTAIALAADSAVTIGDDRQPKIFNTVNKVFMLSKRHPIGVMVYGNARLMSAPWETIVKLYRAKLGAKDFGHLEDYSSNFLRFLEGSRLLFPASEQGDYFRSLVLAFYRCINGEIESAVQKHIERTGKISMSNIRTIATARVKSHFDELEKCKRLGGFTQQFERRLLQKHSVLLRQLQKQVFQKLPLDPTSLAKIRTMSGWLFSKDSFRLQGTSGLVVAGFGDKNIYPRLTEFTVEGVIEGKLRFCPRRHTQIGPACTASIVPFAQTEVVRGFIDGVDPSMERLLNKFLDEVFANYPSALLGSVKGLTPRARALAVKKTKVVSQEILKKFRKEFSQFRRETLVDPIVSTVAVLPKEELAAMAEALVNLTSFKRRFSPNAETVGGPIDVAVLSKGDGFIWVRRKHYFKPELNPHFSTNYFRDA
jgi:hypothetical protein